MNRPCPVHAAAHAFGRGTWATAAGLLWHENALKGLGRLFFAAFATGEHIVGNWSSSGLNTSRPAQRCPECGTIVLPGAA